MVLPMSPKAQELMRRRLLLQQRSQALRADMAQQGQALVPWLQAADTVRAVGRWVACNPLWVGVAVATMAVVRPRRTLSLGLRLWTGWQWWNRARGAWQDASARH